MSVFDRIDYLQAKTPEPAKEAVKQLPMPKLSFADIDALQQEPSVGQVLAETASVVTRKKPGRPPKAKP